MQISRITQMATDENIQHKIEFVSNVYDFMYIAACLLDTQEEEINIEKENKKNDTKISLFLFVRFYFNSATLYICKL